MNKLTTNLKNKELNVPTLTKLYVWSVLFEPLLYFVIVPQNISGIGGNISRVFQFIVLISLLFKVLLTMKIKFSSPFSSTNIYFTYYYIFIIAIGIYGYLEGSYSYVAANPPTLSETSIVSQFINNAFFRPFFEYFIVLYYFVYFVVLAQYMLINKQSIDYFFRWFNVLFLTCLFIGFADLLLVVLFNPGYDGLGRHIADNSFPGSRFHGIAGEPRDAFVYLILCLGIFTLRDIWQKQKKLTFFWIAIIIIAVYLTQSFSGILGIIFTIFLLSIFYLYKLSLMQNIFIIFVFFLSTFIVVLNIKYSIRMTAYYDAFFTLYQALNNGQSVDSILRVTMNNIYPVWHLWLEVRELNFSHLFFGNGLSSSSNINNYYFNELGVLNPNASFIRMLYETGIIGIFLFIFAFIKPLRKLSIDYKIYNKLLFLMLTMLGVYFSHRSVAPYLFFGIILVVFRYRLMEKNLDIKLKNEK